jgi:hypothetical protein
MVDVSTDDVRRLCALAAEHLESSIHGARRADGLYHSYNLVSFPDAETAHVDHLGPMLEGQVAALSSGALGAEAALELIDALFASDMYRPDQDTFLLYPAGERPRFLERNLVPAGSRWSASELDDSLGRIFATDLDGRLRFRPDVINGEVLAELLDETALSEADRDEIAGLYEEVFHHRSFTGRSGSMHGYEGIGSVYWHMVAKLLLAVQETYWAAIDQRAPDELVRRLAEAYCHVRSGLGFRKAPDEFGAIPTDCYSHTPAHAGAQQPGMTGQVKEEVLTRFGELGLRVVSGRVSLSPGLLAPSEVLPSAGGSDGGGTATFTWCSVPMTIERGEVDGVMVVGEDGDRESREGLELSDRASRELLARAGTIAGVVWTIGRETFERWHR